MKKYILCSLLLAILSSLESKAQDGIIAGDNALIITTLFNRLPDYEKVLGSQYIDDHFMTAIANKNAKQKHVLRYNNNTGYFEERKKTMKSFHYLNLLFIP